ncbi:hypothetical protein BGZ61DRAFT_458425 [Ilyonectria robusta]|uniref:uncharacterized protein n=1 Tax=Ilyonectria robusta TaxID=1079257 RepID=UPI001E8D403B|nr:uncharacterized protein BGZ61DRAFT_458425 [Ilyonectria robusta]KAH8675186.1 hypothetical protein BGZ61DRAFT_458425 [Ilyonectria robusta]
MAMSRWLCGFCWLWSRDSAVGHPRGGIKGETQRGGVVVGVVDGLQVSSLVDEAHSTGVLDPLLVFRSGKLIRMVFESRVVTRDARLCERDAPVA